MGCPVQSQEFVSVILVDLFQLRKTYDSVDSAGNAALRGGYEFPQCSVGCNSGTERPIHGFISSRTAQSLPKAGKTQSKGTSKKVFSMEGMLLALHMALGTPGISSAAFLWQMSREGQLGQV